MTGDDVGARGRARVVGALRRLGRGACTVGLAVAVVATGLVVPFATAPAGAAEQEFTITGKGYGHGRGMGQWGAYGYATQYGWGHKAITDHFYGGTRLASDATGRVVDVALLSRGASPLVVTGTGLAMPGVALNGATSVRVTRTGDEQWLIQKAASCAPGTTWSTIGTLRGVSEVEVRTRSGLDPNSAANFVGICQGDGIVRGYRGSLVTKDVSGAQVSVNRVSIEGYLRGVLPREMPAAWGSAPNGMAALRAQAVAARSYALSGMYRPWAHTCDTTTCQVYGGAWTRPVSSTTRTSLEDSRTNQAVVETAGQVRRFADNRIARTEFSASTGGWSAGGQFPAVQDLGDGVAANPNRSWTVTLTSSQVGARLGTGPVTDIIVLSRNGISTWGGRVLEVEVRSSSGNVRMSGDTLRTRLGLKSTWITISTVSLAASQAFVRAAYVDLFGREPDAGGLSSWSNALVAGMPRSQVARALVYSDEHVRSVVEEFYLGALLRSAGSSDGGDWVDILQAGGDYNDVGARIYASPESLQKLGGGDVGAWVAGMYEGILGRTPEAGAVAYWTEMTRKHGRYSTAKMILASLEGRTLRTREYYQHFLGRPADAGGLALWVDAMKGGRDLVVITGLVASTEYYLRAQARYPG